MRPARIAVYRTGEFVFLLLIAFYFSGGLPFLPASWFTVFDANPKIYRKLLTFTAAGAVILGLALFEWARRDSTIGDRSLLIKVVGTWKTRSTAWVVGIFALFGAWWTTSSLLRHFAFQTSFDMAIFTQAVWNTTQGSWFYSSIKGGICLLGDHFAPLLAALALPYRLWPEPGFLLAIQAFAAAACVFPLARIVRRSGQSSSWAVLYCLMFAIYLPVRNAMRFDFHPEVVAMPFLFWAFTFLNEKKLTRASLFLSLALMAKENMATVAFTFGVYAAFFMKKGTVPMPGNFRKAEIGAVSAATNQKTIKAGTASSNAPGGQSPRLWGIGWMMFSALYFYAVVQYFIPKLSGAPYFYLGGNFTEWLRLGWGPFAKHILQPSTLEYLTKIYGPLAFTSVLAPAPFILTLPTLAQNLLSRNEMTRSLFFQYTATLTPFVFISSVMALAKIRSYRRYWAYGILLTSVLFSGTSEIYPMRRQWITITPHAAMVKATLLGIPQEASLRTHEFYAPHVANRKELHIYENNHPKEGGSWKARHTDYVAIDRQLFKEGFDDALQSLKQEGYKIDFEKNGFYILKKTAD